jgi:hypothetical protein
MANVYKIIRAARRASMLAAACLLAAVVSANAFAIKENGEVEIASALYVAGPGGAAMKIAQIGDSVAGGGVLSQIGRPAMGARGSVAFSAEVQTRAGSQWEIFQVHPGAAMIELRPLLAGSTASARCRPELKVDPEVSVSADGSIYFLASAAGGRSALFRLANGKLTCPVSAGDRTAQGHSITSIYFGTAQVASNGIAIFKARLMSAGGRCKCGAAREAVLLSAPGHGASEVALEGERAPGGGRYAGHFGAPAVAGSGSGVIVSFTDRDDRGKSALFLGPPRRLARTIVTGAATPAGKLTYLSDGAPGISDAGYVAIRFASGDRSGILSIRDGEPAVAAREGDTAPGGWKIAGFDDPIMSPSGEIEVETSDADGSSHVLKLPGTEAPNASAVDSGSVALFPHSLALDGAGDSAFLSAAGVSAAARDTRSHAEPQESDGGSI